MDNLGVMAPVGIEDDENAELRREAEAARAELRRMEEEKRTGPEQQDDKDKKKKKKKKKEGKRIKGSSGKKDLKVVFGGTGLDPDPEVRKNVIRTARKVRKKAKKKRRRLSSEGSTSTSSTSSTSDEIMIDSEVFEGQRESQRLWKRTPGALALSTILEAQQCLLTRQGMHPDVQKGPLPPIMVQYFRGQLQPVMTPALVRESHHASLCKGKWPERQTWLVNA